VVKPAKFAVRTTTQRGFARGASFVYNTAPMAKITFLGAAGTVTGSKYLVETNGKRLLVDCGLFQGGKELRLRNWDHLPQDPGTFNWAVLTHAHIDHTGYLPRLVSDGYKGPIYADAATIELCNYLLPDSARLQEEDAENAAKGGYSKHAKPLPLYTEEEAMAALKHFQEMPRTGAFQISPEFTVRPHDAGHILGSSSLELTITENGKSFVVLFSGDIGRYGQPILKDPETPPRADYLLCESTYGDRDHPSDPNYDQLADVINRVAKRGGVIVVPAFAVDRTQLLTYVIGQLQAQNRIPALPIYVDSPMANSVTDLYRKHHEDHGAVFTQKEAAGDPLNSISVHAVRTVDESKKISAINTPCIIISASGMATGGRVLFHLARRLPDARNAVLFCGFQAEGTRGRALLEGAKTLRIHGEDVVVKAEVVDLPQFSAHAGKSELMRWLTGMPAPPRMTFIVHGEPAASIALESAIQSAFKWKTTRPQYLQTFDLLP
jgi:metallo-beta-lactamase family protein